MIEYIKEVSAAIKKAETVGVDVSVGSCIDGQIVDAFLNNVISTDAWASRIENLRVKAIEDSAPLPHHAVLLKRFLAEQPRDFFILLLLLAGRQSRCAGWRCVRQGEGQRWWSRAWW
jgi:hypothetical protein